MLRDLTVQNYRCFEDFHIDGLEQVNLFVGNNNSGKTSLLEAIYLFSSPQTNVALKHILLERQEYVENQYITSNIFTGHKYSANRDILLSSSKNGDRKITIGLNDYSSDTLSIQGNTNTELRELGEILLFKERTNDSIAQLLSLQLSNCLYVSTNNRNAKYSAVLWDNIILTPKEDKIIEALQIIEPKVKKIGFSVSQFHQTIRLKIENKDNPIPITSMGEGMSCILTLAISLVTAENGVLLVDEIETGLHYEAQTDMWRLILETAKELNVQVFATTHSWDCISAFQEALSQVEDKSIGKLFRLDSKYGKLRAVEYDADDLDIATREGIEVR